MNNLTQRRQGAKTRKEQLLCFLCAFYDFAPLREMLLLIQGLFHSILRHGLRSSARFAGWRETTANSTTPGPLLIQEGN
jgi:hypothetical protein